jgi:hypothetical protein
MPVLAIRVIHPTTLQDEKSRKPLLGQQVLGVTLQRTAKPLEQSYGWPCRMLLLQRFSFCD